MSKAIRRSSSTPADTYFRSWLRASESSIRKFISWQLLITGVRQTFFVWGLVNDSSIWNFSRQTNE